MSILEVKRISINSRLGISKQKRIRLLYTVSRRIKFHTRCPKKLPWPGDIKTFQNLEMCTEEIPSNSFFLSYNKCMSILPTCIDHAAYIHKAHSWGVCSLMFNTCTPNKSLKVETGQNKIHVSLICLLNLTIDTEV